MSYKIGIVGLGVMGQNLALNMERNGFPVAGYDLDKTKTQAFLAGEAQNKKHHRCGQPRSVDGCA